MWRVVPVQRLGGPIMACTDPH